jgi:hypothetical protein
MYDVMRALDATWEEAEQEVLSLSGHSGNKCCAPAVGWGWPLKWLSAARVPQGGRQ